MESIINMILSEETRVVLTFAQMGISIGIVWTIAKLYFSDKADKKAAQKEIEIIKVDIDKNCTKLKEHDLKHNETEVITSVLRTKLDGIELGIADIKTMLLKHIDK